MGFFQKFRVVFPEPDEFVNELKAKAPTPEIRLSSSREIYLPMFFMTSAVRGISRI